MRSQDILQGPEWANVRALYKASGYTKQELEKPIIGIVNTYNGICPGHKNLDEVTARVRDGILASGGTAVEFRSIGACDGVAMAHDGMKYILPGRECIANDIEVMCQAHRLDGLVLVGSCDKIVPGLILGALRVNLPAILVNGGPALPGIMRDDNPYGGKSIDHSIIQQSEGALKSGLITKEQFDWFEDNAVPTIGSCAMLGTANTMTALSEALGLSLPYCSAIPAVYSQRMQIAYETGIAIMNLVAKDIKARDIVTKEAIENAVMLNSAIGGSTNAVLHILAIAYEAQVEFNQDDFGLISASVPHLVAMIPAGIYTLLDFYRAGGVPALMQEIKEKLHTSCITCTTKTVSENLDGVCNLNKDVIHSIDNPVHNYPGIAVLKGNLAPLGAITKPSAIPSDAHVFKGRAVIFENEQDALLGIRSLKVKEGDVIVIRNAGPKGGPGMPEQYKAMKLLVGMNLGSKVCVITDGRFSGSNNGCFVGHICPEAYDDGPIKYLENGDIISIDVDKGIICADVDFKKRKEDYKKIAKDDEVQGYLYNYRHNVAASCDGAYIKTRKDK